MSDWKESVRLRGKAFFGGDDWVEGVLQDIDEDGDPEIVDDEGRGRALKSETVTVVTSSVSETLPEEPPVTARLEVLREASRLVHSDRNATYGEPTGNFSDTAAIWNVQFAHKLSTPFSPDDVAQAMIGLKLARLKAGNKQDNWIDIAGYAACGWEASGRGDA